MTFKTAHCPFYIYMGAVTLLIALSFGVSAAALHILLSPTFSSDEQRTLLADRVESAREIRLRLATPLAAPEPGIVVILLISCVLLPASAMCLGDVAHALVTRTELKSLPTVAVHQHKEQRNEPRIPIHDRPPGVARNSGLSE